MNGHKKFHKANGPAFSIGEQWQSISGKAKVSITGVRKYKNCDGKWDYEVSYMQADGVEHSKNAWCFQVRYECLADKEV